VGQSTQAPRKDQTKKEAVPNQQNPEKKQDKEPMTAGSTEKSGAKK
jgi:hypothetical protein